MNYYQRALALQEETITHRRYFHENAEVGLDLPRARAYVQRELEACGLRPEVCGYGITASVGKPGKVLLLRADMDALPMEEESGESFSSKNAGTFHGCGHDFHGAMLLTAAKMLKESEETLEGTVRFMFQPGEETLEGADNMLKQGVLEKPSVDAAMAIHVAAGRMPVGTILYNGTGIMMHSVDNFQIHIKGKGGHGAYPHRTVDPIRIGVHIYLALEALIAGETDPERSCVLTIGSFTAGSTGNVIPETALLQGAVRTDDQKSRELLMNRLEEITVGTAAALGGTARVELLARVPPLVCDPVLTEEMVGYIREMDVPGAVLQPGISASASEDFSLIAEKVPSTYLYLSAGYPDERGEAGAHNPMVRFNEEVCPVGAACLAHCAERWLSNNKE